MQSITVTAKIQLSVSSTDKICLNNTMSAYRAACNYVSDYVFDTYNLKPFSINQVLYTSLRETYGLKSQIAQSVIKTVIAKYKTILENEGKWRKADFKKPQYDLVWNSHTFIYKTKQNQDKVIQVNPAYTSQTCPICGHTEMKNRNKKMHLFCCKNCGYKSNDNRIGAMNLYRMGIEYLVPDTVMAE